MAENAIAISGLRIFVVNQPIHLYEFDEEKMELR